MRDAVRMVSEMAAGWYLSEVWEDIASEYDSSLYELLSEYEMELTRSEESVQC